MRGQIRAHDLLFELIKPKSGSCLVSGNTHLNCLVKEVTGVSIRQWDPKKKKKKEKFKLQENEDIIEKPRVPSTSPSLYFYPEHLLLLHK